MKEMIQMNAWRCVPLDTNLGIDSMSSLLFHCPDEGDEYMAMCAPRYKPEELEKISNKTKFSKAELQVMYRGFKQVRTMESHLVVENAQRMT